jgi:hypothetical protein
MTDVKEPDRAALARAAKAELAKRTERAKERREVATVMLGSILASGEVRGTDTNPGMRDLTASKAVAWADDLLKALS